MKACLPIALVIVLAVSMVQAADSLKAFPPPEKGFVRYVLQLPKQENEAELKVELIIGRSVQTDEINRYFFAGRIEAETIEGWGFTRYTVPKFGPLAGTKMAVDPNAPKVERFIQLGGDAYLIRYNSRLPIVVYVPEGVEARYRIWSAGSGARSIDRG